MDHRFYNKDSHYCGKFQEERIRLETVLHDPSKSLFCRVIFPFVAFSKVELLHYNLKNSQIGHDKGTQKFLTRIKKQIDSNIYKECIESENR